MIQKITKDKGDQDVYDNYQETEESYGDVTYEEYQ